MLRTLRHSIVAAALALPVAAGLSCLALCTAHAQEAMSEAERKSVARDLLDQARQAQEADAHEKAIELLRQADQIYEHPSHGWFLGVSFEKRGQLLDAKEAYQRFVLAEPSSDQMRRLQEEAKARMEALEPRIPKLTVTVRQDEIDVEKLSILIDGKGVPLAAFNLPLRQNPGEHTISVESDRYHLVGGTRTVELEEGATKLVELEFEAIESVEEPPPNPSTTTEPSTQETAMPIAKPKKKSNGLLIGGVATAGAGIVGVAVGTVFLVNAGSKKSDRDNLLDNCVSDDALYCAPGLGNDIDTLTDDEEKARTNAAVFYGIGGFALAAGVTMMMLTRGRGREKAERQLRPYVGVGSAGITGRF